MHPEEKPPVEAPEETAHETANKAEIVRLQRELEETNGKLGAAEKEKADLLSKLTEMQKPVTAPGWDNFLYYG